MSLVTFTKGAIANFRQTAAVVPSSKQLAKAMVDPLRDKPQRVVVEFGPGTGVMTRELLQAMPPDSLLLAFEVNPSFVDYLRDSISDDRFQVVSAGAETAAGELDRRSIGKVDAVVSSLGIAAMDSEVADAIFRSLQPYLEQHGTITQFQYVYRMRVVHGRMEYFNTGRFMSRYFSTVRSTRVWFNFPPAVVITCTGALPAAPLAAA